MDIMSFYDVEISNICELRKSHMNRVFIADNKYVIKFYNKEVSLKEIEDEIVLYQLLQVLTTVRVPNLIKNKCNQLLSVDNSGNYFTISDFIDGYVTFKYNAENIISSAKTLAQLHSDIYEHIKKIKILSTNKAVMDCENLTKTIENACKKNKLDITLIEKALQKADNFHKSERCKSLLRFSIHGDFGGDNLIFNHYTNKVNAIIDFAESRIDSPLYDLVMTYFLLNEDNESLATLFMDTYFNNLSEILSRKLSLDRKCFNEIILSMFVYELYLMVISKKNDEIKEAFKMVAIFS